MIKNRKLLEGFERELIKKKVKVKYEEETEIEIFE